MQIEKIPFIAGEESYPGEFNANSTLWSKYDTPSFVRKGGIALSLQWHKSSDVNELLEHMRTAGGTEMAAQAFANGIVNHLDGYMSRTDLKHLALGILLELERKNQETPNPHGCEDIVSAVSRIQSQVSKEASFMRDLPRNDRRLRAVDPRNEPNIQIVTGERFTVSLPTRVEDGYVWWVAEIDSPFVSTVSTLKFDPMAPVDGVSSIETVFTFQGMHAGTSTMKFKLYRSFGGGELIAEIALDVSIDPYTLKN